MDLGGLLQYAQEHGVWPVLFLALVLGGIPWILRREKKHQDRLELANEKHMDDVKEITETNNQMALTFNDTVNKFNNTIEHHTGQMQIHAEQMQKISLNLDTLTQTMTRVVDSQFKVQTETSQWRYENEQLKSRIEKNVSLMEEVNRKLSNK